MTSGTVSSSTWSELMVGTPWWSLADWLVVHGHPLSSWERRAIRRPLGRRSFTVVYGLWRTGEMEETWIRAVHWLHVRRRKRPPIRLNWLHAAATVTRLEDKLVLRTNRGRAIAFDMRPTRWSWPSLYASPCQSQDRRSASPELRPFFVIKTVPVGSNKEGSISEARPGMVRFFLFLFSGFSSTFFPLLVWLID